MIIRLFKETSHFVFIRMCVTKIGVIDGAVLVAKKATMTFGTQIATIKTSEKVAQKATIRKGGKQMIKC